MKRFLAITAALTISGCIVEPYEMSEVRLGLALQALGDCTRNAEGVLDLEECGAFVSLTLETNDTLLLSDEGPGDKRFVFSTTSGEDRTLILNAWRTENQHDGTSKVFWYTATDTFDCPPGDTVTRTLEVSPLGTVHVFFDLNSEENQDVTVQILEIDHKILLPTVQETAQLLPGRKYQATLLNADGQAVAVSNSFTATENQHIAFKGDAQ